MTVIARSRADGAKGSGADYLYTYLRTYYRDDTKATGWNNLAFPNVAMPHALWELQGEQRAVFADEKKDGLAKAAAGSLAAQYSLFAVTNENAIDELRGVNVEDLTADESKQLLARIKGKMI